MPVTLKLSQDDYMLLGVIIFQPPIVGTVGHYVSAIKVTNKFIVYDDMRSKTYIIPANKKVVIHALFYVRNK